LVREPLSSCRLELPIMPLPGIKIAPPLPQLRIQGKWLQQAGFEIGTVVKVRVARGCLVVEADPVQNEERLYAQAPTVNVVHEPDTHPLDHESIGCQ
jgi:hypothetical protein